MERRLFLHEIVDIVGQGAWRYMERTAEAQGDETPHMALLGTWYTMGITGRWPQVVNLWEYTAGWDDWRGAVDRLNLQRESNEALRRWWQEAYTVRTGGFDRVVAGDPGCPSRAELEAAGVRGSLFVHELSTVRPGAALDYLAAMREEWLPVAAEYGHAASGATRCCSVPTRW